MSSEPIDLTEIKDIVLKDWQKSKRIEKVLNESEKDLNILDKLSDLHNLIIKESEINIGFQELPTKLISDIFKASKGAIVQLFEEEKVYIVKITDIAMPDSINQVEDLSLLNDLKGSFGNELIKNKKISTNDKLIEAVINRY